MTEVELAALLCSRLCHDLISPVGALNNGLEVMAEDDDAEMQAEAMHLVRVSAEQASAKLLFARLAFGAAGGTGGSLELEDARAAAEGVFAFAKPSLEWHAPRGPYPKDVVRLLLNMTLLALGAVPRGGKVTVSLRRSRNIFTLSAVAAGPRAALSENDMAQLAGTMDEVDARSIQARFARLIAEQLGARLIVEPGEERLTLRVEIPAEDSATRAA